MVVLLRNLRIYSMRLRHSHTLYDIPSAYHWSILSIYIVSAQDVCLAQSCSLIVRASGLLWAKREAPMYHVIRKYRDFNMFYCLGRCCQNLVPPEICLLCTSFSTIGLSALQRYFANIKLLCNEHNECHEHGAIMVHICKKTHLLFNVSGSQSLLPIIHLPTALRHPRD